MCLAYPKVWLDIDDKSEDGRGPYDLLICVVYLEDSNLVDANVSIVEKETALDYYDQLLAGNNQEDPDKSIDESINITHPFNLILVDAGHAKVKGWGT